MMDGRPSIIYRDYDKSCCPNPCYSIFTSICGVDTTLLITLERKWRQDVRGLNSHTHTGGVFIAGGNNTGIIGHLLRCVY